MKIIDTHIHFWELENNINSWVMKQSNKELQKNYLPDNIIHSSNNDLIGVVHVEAHDSAKPTIEEITWLSEKMKNSALQYKHIAFVDITSSLPIFAKTIDQIIQFTNVVGIRHILSHTTKFGYNPNEVDLSSNKNIKENLEYLAKNNLIFDCQVYSHQMKNLMPAIINSKVTTVIDHMLLPAWNSYNDEDCNLWKEMLTQVSILDNVYLKLSGLDMFQDRNNFDLVVKYCLEKFNNNRLIYGSNYPVSFTNDYNMWYNYLSNLGLSAVESEQIFYKNAMKLFKFN